MSSRTAAANSFSLTNYKIPLLCNACKYLRHVLSNSQSNFQTTNDSQNGYYIFITEERITRSGSVGMFFEAITNLSTTTYCTEIHF